MSYQRGDVLKVCQILMLRMTGLHETGGNVEEANMKACRKGHPRRTGAHPVWGVRPFRQSVMTAAAD
jgi:hypothetical protein